MKIYTLGSDDWSKIISSKLESYIDCRCTPININQAQDVNFWFRRIIQGDGIIINLDEKNEQMASLTTCAHFYNKPVIAVATHKTYDFFYTLLCEVIIEEEDLVRYVAGNL